MSNIVIIDYGIGNLLSMQRALEHCGYEAKISANTGDILGAHKVILPGVGAFADGMAGLVGAGLVDTIKEYALTGRSFLGVCVGMQLLFEWGEEFGVHQGLGLIPGRVIAVPAVGSNGVAHKIPHIGWNSIYPTDPAKNWATGSVLKDIPVGSHFYYVHSYMAAPTNMGHCVAQSDYDGIKITGLVNKDNIWGTQFHPEKSGEAGLSLLKNFCSLP